MWEPLPGFNHYYWPVLSRVIKLSLKEKREMQKNQNRSRHMGMPTYTQTDRHTHTHTHTSLYSVERKKHQRSSFFQYRGQIVFIYFRNKLAVWQKAFALIRISCCPKCICVVGVKGN